MKPNPEATARWQQRTRKPLQQKKPLKSTSQLQRNTPLKSTAPLARSGEMKRRSGFGSNTPEALQERHSNQISRENTPAHSETPTPTLRASKMRKRSKAKKERDALYEPIRVAYKAAHPFCECGCGRPTDVVHHRARRHGLNLFRFLMAVANTCHERIHANTRESKRMGYFITVSARDATATEEEYALALYPRQQ